MSSTETAPSDPVLSLIAERFRIEEEAEAKVEPIESADDAEEAEIATILDRASKRIARLDKRIAATVAISPAGLVGQVHVLLELGFGEYSDADADHDGTTATAWPPRSSPGSSASPAAAPIARRSSAPASNSVAPARSGCARSEG